MAEQTDKMMMLLTQEEAGYTPVSTAQAAACSSCRWFCPGMEYGDECRIVQNWPEPIAPNGICNRHEVVPSTDPEPLEVVIVGEMMQKETVNEDGLFDRIWHKIQSALNPQQDSAFAVQKDLNGVWRWRATFTNNFKDRDGEIISEKALDGYLKRVEMGLVPMPELWVGHVEGTKHGVADLVFGLGNFVTAVGHFDTPEDGEKAARFARKYPNAPLSHGFTFPKWALKDGVYDVVNVFEISILPPPLVASNPFTEFEVKTMEKELNPKTEAALVIYFGKEKVENLKANLLQRSEETKEAGLAFKDFAEITEQPATETPAEEKPAEAPAVAELLAQILDGQAELERLLTASGKAYTALKAQAETDKSAAEKRIAALEDLVTKLQSELRLSPRAASSAVETKLTETEAQAVKDAQAATEADPFFQI